MAGCSWKQVAAVAFGLIVGLGLPLLWHRRTVRAPKEANGFYFRFGERQRLIHHPASILVAPRPERLGINCKRIGTAQYLNRLATFSSGWAIVYCDFQIIPVAVDVHMRERPDYYGVL